MDLQIKPKLLDLLYKEKALDMFISNIVEHLSDEHLFENYDLAVERFNELDELQQLNSFHWHFGNNPTEEKYEYWLKISNKLVKQLSK